MKLPIAISACTVCEDVRETPYESDCETAGSTADTADQAAALERFAKNLLAKTEDTPQAIVNVLNQRFWDLV